MCCPKCEEKVREELSELDGVYEISVDQLSERVTVIGFVDPFQALRKMKRIKKKSQFWDGSRAALASSLDLESSYKKSFHKKPHSRHETVYRASPSQISYNRGPSSRSSGSRALSYRTKHGSYDDGISYSGLRPAIAKRNRFYGAYDDEISYSDAIANRNRYFGAYDDGISYSDLRQPAIANRNRYHGAYDDEIVYTDLHPSGSYVNQYGSSPDLLPSSALFSRLPQSQSLRYESVPPFAQMYYTEEPAEEYPFYTHY